MDGGGVANATADATEGIERVVIRLIEADALGLSALARGRRAAEASKERLDEVLIKLGLVDEKALRDSWSEVSGVPVIEQNQFPTDAVLDDVLSAKFLRTAGAIPVGVRSGRLELAVSDPLDKFTPAAVTARCGHPVDIFLATRSAIEAAQKQLYPEATIDEAETATPAHKGIVFGDVTRLRDLASDAPAINLTESIIEQAIEAGASDIHLTLTRKGPQLRFRIDGMLLDREQYPAHLHESIVSRLKVLADLDIAERRLPQDGRIRLGVDGREVDLRIATMPHLEGEGAVLRILDHSSVTPDLPSLGFVESIEAGIADLLNAPHGIFLVTGPTGSGKTTTLYAALRRLALPSRNVISVEDPVEYYLDRVAQIQVNRKIGLDFPTVLRAVLRQDPDVIMVGEIRDGETARIANQAALTGHVVLATLHTNSAAASLPRLIDMGVEPYLLASTIRGVLSQRLVRKLCPKCARKGDFTRVKNVASRIAQFGSTKLDACELLVAVGCAHCNGTGFKGRIAIAELLLIDEEVRDALLQRADAERLEEIARNSGFVQLRESGLMKVKSGETTLEELERVIGAGADR